MDKEYMDFVGTTRQGRAWFGTVAGRVVSGPHRTRTRAAAQAARAACVVFR
jgi:hypothetical protein